MRFTAPATFAGIATESIAPAFREQKYLCLDIDGSTIRVPIDDKRTVATIAKRMPREWSVTVACVSEADTVQSANERR